MLCSVGVARCKLLAKLASRAAKPAISPNGPITGSGVFVVLPEDELDFLHPRPVSDLWGVGPRTAERLARYGISTIGDLATIDVAHLGRLVGRAAGMQLHELAWGRDDRPVIADRPLKSVGHEETFAVDMHDPEKLRLEAVRMADSVRTRRRLGFRCPDGDRQGPIRRLHDDHAVGTRLRRPIASSAEAR